MAYKYQTLPIGTIFTYKGNKYQVCEYDNPPIPSCCKLCAFCNVICDTNKDVRGECFAGRRSDNRQVYFKFIENNKDMDKVNTIIPGFATNTSLNDLHIECPKGYSIDVNNSDLSKGIIKFKKDNITLNDVYKDDNTEYATNLVILVESKLGNKLSAIAKLIDIANYYNKDWKPDWNDGEERKYYIYVESNNEYTITYCNLCKYNVIYFKNQEDAKAVIKNPNFRDILDTIYKD